ncbi:glycohydrolase toxin TNT-related protein [Orenia marismortui]|uniref:glycohydrolase toxin TNT-related protein n=1 Tax=Orenia marismortui TaxID=46469 RepID=UPI0003A4D228|nr:glycohydrolase toxin TNT-related protein [Orenia marismortui]
MVKVYRRETKVNIVYDYDSVGNRISKKIIDPAGVENTVYNYYKGTNRLKSYSIDSKNKYAYVYDPAGNLIKKGNKYSIEGEIVNFTEISGDGVEYWEYKYNLQGRLAKVYKNEELIAEFSYDADDKRIKTIEHTHDGSVKETNFVYSVSGNVIFEDESGDYTSYIFALNKQYAKVNGIVGVSTDITYFHQDNLGSTRLMTNANGKVIMDQDYLPFGGDLARPNQIEVKNDSGENYKYTGQKQVVSIGLYFYGARYYDPEIGRFTREDTYKGELDDPQSQNVYIYVLANPLRYIDPTGHWNEESKWYNPFTWFDTQEDLIGQQSLETYWQMANSNDASSYIADFQASANLEPTGTLNEQTANSLNYYKMAYLSGKEMNESDWLINRYRQTDEYFEWKLTDPVAADLQVAKDAKTALEFISFVQMGTAAYSEYKASKLVDDADGGARFFKELMDWADDFNTRKMFTDKNGNIIWPSNNGFLSKQNITLPKGFRIDRYGNEFGSFVAQEGTPDWARALAPGTTTNAPYYIYETLKPIENVYAGRAVPWFNEPGMGMQYKFDRKILDLLNDGYLKEVGP